jgi:hypothetical protein
MNLLLPLIFIFLIFESLLKQYNLITGYEDELIVGLIFVYSVFKYGMPKNYFKFIILFLVFNILSAYFSKYKFNAYLFLLDTILFLKPVLFLISLKLLNSEIYKTNIKYIIMVCRVFIFVSFLFLPLHYSINLFEANFFRFDLAAYQFFYTNPGKFLNIILITGLFSFSIKKDRYSFLFYLFSVILILSTLRFKGFILLIPIILLTSFPSIKSKLMLFIKSKVITKRLFSLKTLAYLFPLILLFILPAITKFNNVFLDNEEGIAPRLLFIYASIEIFISQFPFGVGPGYFGSAAANMFYSPVYVDLGWSNLRGLGENSSVNYLNDTFWPMIMAQYGFLGLLVVLKMFKSFIYDYLNKIIINSDSFLFVFVSMISIISGTFGSSTFIGTLGMLYIISNFFLGYITSYEG